MPIWIFFFFFLALISLKFWVHPCIQLYIEELSCEFTCLSYECVCAFCNTLDEQDSSYIQS